MTLFTLAVVNVIRLRRRLLVVVATLVFSVAVVLVGAGLGGHTQQTTSDRLDHDVALRQLNIYQGGERKLDQQTIERLRADPSVESVQPVVIVPVAEESTRSVLAAVNYRPAAGIPVEFPSPRTEDLRGNEVVLPSSVRDVDFTQFIGKDLDISYTTATGFNTGRMEVVKMHVVGTYDPSWQIDAQFAAYISLEYAEQFAAARNAVEASRFSTLIGYERAEITVRSQDSVDKVVRQLQGEGWQVVSVSQQVAEIPGLISMIRAATQVLVVVMCAFALVVALSFSQSLTRQRIREIGLLNALGWSASRITTLLVMEALLVALASVVAGVALGNISSAAISAYLSSRDGLDDVFTRVELPSLTWCVLSAIAGIVSFVVGCLPSVSGAVRKQAVDALREL